MVINNYSDQDFQRLQQQVTSWESNNQLTRIP